MTLLEEEGRREDVVEIVQTRTQTSTQTPSLPLTGFCSCVMHFPVLRQIAEWKAE